MLLQIIFFKCGRKSHPFKVDIDTHTPTHTSRKVIAISAPPHYFGGADNKDQMSAYKHDISVQENV